jgi:hypothetical protein
LSGTPAAAAFLSSLIAAGGGQAASARLLAALETGYAAGGGAANGLLLRSLVARLAGCLGSLPPESRLLLEMRTGVGMPHAFGPAAVAARLHVGLRRYAVMERRAAHQLVQSSSAGGCAAAPFTTGDPSLFGTLEPAFAGALQAAPGAPAGIAAGKHRTPGYHSSPGSGGSLLRGIVPPAAGQALQIALIALGSMLLLGFLFADELDLAERYRRLRLRLPRRHG